MNQLKITRNQHGSVEVRYGRLMAVGQTLQSALANMLELIAEERAA